MPHRVTLVQVVGGAHGFYNVLNTNRMAPGALAVARNITLGDYFWRVGGGAAHLGASIGATVTCKRGIDYWPSIGTQRTIIAGSDGKIWKDDGTGNTWASLVSGLTTSGVPMFAVAGAESVSRNRKLFYADGVNTPQVLSGDGASMAGIATPNADWFGSNQPRWFQSQQGKNWAGGVASAPHTVYASRSEDHEDFNTFPYRLILGPLRDQQYSVGALDYKGGLLVFCFPVGVYFIDTTTDPNPLNWSPALVAWPGASGPNCFVQVEDDVIWVDPNGGWHRLSSALAQQKASVRASDISYQKIPNWGAQNMALAQLKFADMIYYSDRQEIMLAYAPLGNTAKTVRIHLDLNNQTQVGENWIYWDRDRNEALFLRQSSNRFVPTMGDNVGQLWSLDQSARDANGQAYLFEIWMTDTDFASLNPSWAGQWKNLHWFQLEYLLTGTSLSLTVEVWCDGVLRQTLTIALAAGGVSLPHVLPFNLAQSVLSTTRIRRLKGRFRRMAIRIYATQNDSDLSISKFILAMTTGA